VTDQRNRVTTDPGLGPIEREYASTLRSMTAAEPVRDDEIPGAPVYYEPKPLHAVSEHKTLELETVKLAKDIDPRKLPTELKLRRPVLHVLPASDPNWPAPSPQPDAVWPSPQYDSNWPPPETVLTTSQPPLSARRRSFLPLVMLVLLSAALLLLLGTRLLRRSPGLAVATQAALPAPLSAAPSPKSVEPTSGAAPAPAPSNEALPPASVAPSPAPPNSADSADTADSVGAAESAGTADPADFAESPATAVASGSAVASTTATEPGASGAPAPRHAPFKSVPPTIANSSALGAPTTKPKRAIY
jgi:hypothetical protein